MAKELQKEKRESQRLDLDPESPEMWFKDEKGGSYFVILGNTQKKKTE